MLDTHQCGDTCPSFKLQHCPDPNIQRWLVPIQTSVEKACDFSRFFPADEKTAKKFVIFSNLKKSRLFRKSRDFYEKVGTYS
jgi:hypothetical protein